MSGHQGDLTSGRRPNSESLGDTERHAMQVLEPQLREHLTLTANVYNLIGCLLEHMPRGLLVELPPSLRVAIKLLLRLANDIHSADLLALRGYPLQSAALVASVYEVAFTVASIGDDDSLAQEWIDHDDPTQPFRGARAMTRAVIEKLRIADPEAATQRFYRVYRQLCLAKHANPLLQTQVGVDVQTQVVIESNGPDTSDRAVRIAWFALEHAAGSVLLALVDFHNSHLRKYCGADTLIGLSRELEAAAVERERLQAAAVARWGDVDPFAGRW